jgi:hypothetical protein
MLLSGHEMPVPFGYTPLLIGVSGDRRHLLEIRVVNGSSGSGRAVQPEDRTEPPPDVYCLSRRERLVLTVLAQRYLRQEPYPQPVSWQQVAEDLDRLAPGEGWTRKRAEHVVSGVRERLAGTHGVAGLLRDDGIGEPVGNTLNHNLIQALLTTTTLLPEDLESLTAGDAGLLGGLVNTHDRNWQY